MINQFYIDYIKAIENPDRVGWNGKVWTAPQYKGYDKNQRGYGIDIVKNDSAKRLTQNRPGQWLTEGEADKLMREHLQYVYGAAQKHIEGFDNLSDRRKAALLGMLYRGDSVNKNRHIIDINEPDDNKFFESISNYYRSKGLNERAKNSSDFFSNNQQTNFQIPMKWEQWEPPMKFKSGGQVRKMQTASGGPIKKPIKRQKDGYRYIPDEENSGWDRISDNAMSDVFATMEFTPKKTNVGSSITRKQSAPSKTYYSAYDPDAFKRFIKSASLNLSPTQWARRAYDTGKLLTGNMTWSGYTDSWINGNNGVVSQNFKEEHPVLSNSINGGIDLATFSLPKVSLYPVHFVQQVATPITSTYIGAKLGEEVDKYLPKKIQGYGGMLGYMLGAGVGTGVAYKNYSNTPLIHTKYKKLNDVINYPITTAAATVKGKYPWTKKQDIKLKRQLFDDIEEARNFQLKSGYLLEDQPAIRIAKKSQYLEGELGHYTPYYNTITVKSTINPYSNLPIESLESVGSGFKGLVNHELTHGRQQYFGAFSEYDPKVGYYVTRKDIKTPVFDPFRKKKAGSWTASPDEFDAELSNLQISTGKLPTEPVDNIFPLQTRFGIWNKNKAREIENLILQLRKNREFFKDGGKMNILEFLKNGSGIHIKEKNKGKFTSYCGGKVTDECIQKGKNSSNPAIRKRATFAANARKWKHKEGGVLKAQFGLPLVLSPENIKEGFNFVKQGLGKIWDIVNTPITGSSGVSVQLPNGNQLNIQGTQGGAPEILPGKMDKGVLLIEKHAPNFFKLINEFPTLAKNLVQGNVKQFKEFFRTGNKDLLKWFETKSDFMLRTPNSKSTITPKGFTKGNEVAPTSGTQPISETGLNIRETRLGNMNNSPRNPSEKLAVEDWNTMNPDNKINPQLPTGRPSYKIELDGQKIDIRYPKQTAAKKIKTDYTQSGTSLERAVEGKRYGISRKGRVSSNDRNARAMESGDARTTNAGYTNVKKGQIKQVENNLDKYPEYERKALEQRLLRLYRKNRPESEINKVKREFYKYLARRYGYFKIGGVIKANTGTKFNWNSALNTGVNLMGQFLPSIIGGGNNQSYSLGNNYSDIMTNTALQYMQNQQQENEVQNNYDKIMSKLHFDPSNPNANGGSIVKNHINYLAQAPVLAGQKEFNDNYKKFLDEQVKQQKTNYITNALTNTLQTGFDIALNYKPTTKKGSSVS